MEADGHPEDLRTGALPVKATAWSRSIWTRGMYDALDTAAVRCTGIQHTSLLINPWQYALKRTSSTKHPPVYH